MRRSGCATSREPAEPSPCLAARVPLIPPRLLKAPHLRSPDPSRTCTQTNFLSTHRQDKSQAQAGAETLQTGASTSLSRGSLMVVQITRNAHIACVSTKYSSTRGVAERLAIALAIIHLHSSTIITGSQAACPSLFSGKLLPAKASHAPSAHKG